MGLIKVNVVLFNEELLAGINKKRDERKKAFRNMIVSFVLYILLIIVVMKYLMNSEFTLYSVCLSLISVCWIAYFVYITNRVDINTLSKKEKIMFYLYNALTSLEEFITLKEARQLKSVRRNLGRFRDTITDLSLKSLGSNWENEANTFFQEILLYVYLKIIPNLKMDTDPKDLLKQYAFLQELLGWIRYEHFKPIEENILKSNAEFRGSYKGWFDNFKIVVQENKVLKIFSASTIIILIFLIIWGLSIWQQWRLNFYLMAVISCAIPAAIHYTTLIIENTVKKD